MVNVQEQSRKASTRSNARICSNFHFVDLYFFGLELNICKMDEKMIEDQAIRSPARAQPRSVGAVTKDNCQKLSDTRLSIDHVTENRCAPALSMWDAFVTIIAT